MCTWASIPTALCISLRIAPRWAPRAGPRVPLILAEELDADWKRVKLEQAIGDERYGDQNTDGSHSVRSFYDVMRQGGASGALDVGPGRGAEVGRARRGVHDGAACGGAQDIGPQAGLWRAGLCRRKVAGAEERRVAVQAQERLALRRARAQSATTSRGLHRQGRLRDGRADGEHGVRLHRASAGAGRQSEVARRQGSAAGSRRSPDGADRSLPVSLGLSAAGWSGRDRR